MVKRLVWWFYHSEHVRVGSNIYVGYFICDRLVRIGAYAGSLAWSPKS